MLGGNVVVIDEGRVLQTGLTPEVYHNPKNTRVAEVFSDPPINYLEGIVHDGTATLGRDIVIPLKWHMNALSPGKYIFGVRSNHLFLASRNGRRNPHPADRFGNIDLCQPVLFFCLR
jgi:glycerol transport system ATP-binding protein